MAIEHGQGITTLYGHNSKVLVSVGQPVGRGQPIAEMGSTGFSTGSHLHFEIRDGATAVDPVIYVPQLSGAKGSSVAYGYGNTPPPEKEYVNLGKNKVVEVKT